MTKRVAHVIQRARERYGLELTEADVAAIEALVAREAPGVRFIGFLEDGSSRYVVSFKGRELRIMWETRAQVISSLLPEQGRNDGSFKLYQHLGIKREERRRSR